MMLLVQCLVQNLHNFSSVSHKANLPPAPSDCAVFRQVRVELFDRRQTKFISAHTSNLACLALALDGRFLATASERGTLVRVWSTADGTLLQVRCFLTVPKFGIASSGPGAIECVFRVAQCWNICQTTGATSVLTERMWTFTSSLEDARRFKPPFVLNDLDTLSLVVR